jgi:hypothetical protein
MIAVLSITPTDISRSTLLNTFDIHEARREVRRLERLGHTNFQVVYMPRMAEDG